jgi:hypothetical protein
MKNKSTMYVLLAGVLIVWGLIFYRVFAGMNSDDTASFVIPQKKSSQSTTQKEEEPFILIANYRDPFLGGVSRPISNAISTVNNSSRQFKSNLKKSKEVIDWSFLDYIGIVNNKETKKNVGLLIISGKEYMVNDGEVINGVTILRKERDSIQVEYVGEKKWVTR